MIHSGRKIFIVSWREKQGRCRYRRKTSLSHRCRPPEHLFHQTASSYNLILIFISYWFIVQILFDFAIILTFVYASFSFLLGAFLKSTHHNTFEKYNNRVELYSMFRNSCHFVSVAAVVGYKQAVLLAEHNTLVVVDGSGVALLFSFFFIWCVVLCCIVVLNSSKVRTITLCKIKPKRCSYKYRSGAIQDRPKITELCEA